MMKLAFLLALVVASEGTPQHQEPKRGDSAKREAHSQEAVATPSLPPVRHDSAPRADSNSRKLGTEPHKPDSIRITDWIVAAFTAVLGLVACLQLWLLYRQYVATHRPRLVVRQASDVFENGRHFVEFTIANDGGTSAKIVESGAALLLRESGRSLPARPLEETVELVPSQPIRAGKSILVRWQDKWTTKSFGEVRNESGGGTNLFFIGHINYRDGAGTVRRMGFFRQYSWETGRFRNTNDPDFEYAD
jgi:uncharacterized protein (TIGR02588 family)